MNADLAPALADWLPRQRWYGEKGRQLTGVRVGGLTELAPGPPELCHALVTVETASDGGDASSSLYQVFVGELAELPERLEHVRIGPVGDRVAYDALADRVLTGLLLSLLAEGTSRGPLRFRRAPGAEIDLDPPGRLIGVEQSNSSVVFGDAYILKVFRRIAAGVNPDLEVTLALAEAGSTHVAPPLGWIEGDLDGGATATFALLQPFLASATDGWAMATISVRDLLAEGDLHADEVGGDFAGEAERLGTATAQVHADLARALPTAAADAGQQEAMAAGMQGRLDAAVGAVAELQPYAEGAREAFRRLASAQGPLPLQRIHGDYHLGQVLRTDHGWILLDFEGEPARPLAERTRLDSPLRDVAGMLRSFDYAARQLLTDRAVEPQSAYRAAEWAQRNSDAFCAGYGKAAGGDPREHGDVLRAFELDKAVYEVLYEARNRPSWVSIPLGAVARLVG